MIILKGMAHLGIRVHDLDRSLSFYASFGFRKTAGPFGPERVVILEHPSGIEINLIANATSESSKNILMDIPDKHAGITHVAVWVSDLADTRVKLLQAGIAISDGPVTFPTGVQALFVRDPDGNVLDRARCCFHTDEGSRVLIRAVSIARA